MEIRVPATIICPLRERFCEFQVNGSISKNFEINNEFGVFVAIQDSNDNWLIQFPKDEIKINDNNKGVKIKNSILEWGHTFSIDKKKLRRNNTFKVMAMFAEKSCVLLTGLNLPVSSIDDLPCKINGKSKKQTVKIINREINKVVFGDNVVQVGEKPFAICADQAFNNVYVTNSGENNISIIDGINDKVVGFINVGDGPRDIVFDEINRRIYVANYNDNSVSIIDANINKTIETFSTKGLGPTAVGLDAVENRIYVVNSVSNTVDVFDVESGNANFIKSIKVGERPLGIAVNPNVNELYVSNSGDGTVDIIDSASFEIFASVEIGVRQIERTGIKPIEVKGRPRNLLYYNDPIDGHLIYVTDILNKTVDIIRLSDKENINTIHLEGIPRKISFNHDNNLLYVVMGGDKRNVGVYDLDGNNLKTSFITGRNPLGIATLLDGESEKVYIANKASNNIAVFAINNNFKKANLEVSFLQDDLGDKKNQRFDYKVIVNETNGVGVGIKEIRVLNSEAIWRKGADVFDKNITSRNCEDGNIILSGDDNSSKDISISQLPGFLPGRSSACALDVGFLGASSFPLGKAQKSGLVTWLFIGEDENKNDIVGIGNIMLKGENEGPVSDANLEVGFIPEIQVVKSDGNADYDVMINETTGVDVFVKTRAIIGDRYTSLSIGDGSIRDFIDCKLTGDLELILQNGLIQGGTQVCSDRKIRPNAKVTTDNADGIVTWTFFGKDNDDNQTVATGVIKVVDAENDEADE